MCLLSGSERASFDDGVPREIFGCVVIVHFGWSSALFITAGIFQLAVFSLRFADKALSVFIFRLSVAIT